MKITSEMKKGCAVFVIDGSVELFAADEIERTISQAVKKKSYDRVVIDLHGVDYIDSTGIGAFLKLTAAFRGITAIRICGLQPTIASLFKVINMNKLVPVDGTVDESIRALTAGRS